MRRFLYIDVYQLSVLSSAFFPCSINGWHFLSSLREVISLRIPWDMQERNTAVFLASALFEKRGFALLSTTGRMKIHE